MPDAGELRDLHLLIELLGRLPGADDMRLPVASSIADAVDRLYLAATPGAQPSDAAEARAAAAGAIPDGAPPSEVRRRAFRALFKIGWRHNPLRGSWLFTRATTAAPSPGPAPAAPASRKTRPGPTRRRGRAGGG